MKTNALFCALLALSLTAVPGCREQAPAQPAVEIPVPEALDSRGLDPDLVTAIREAVAAVEQAPDDAGALAAELLKEDVAAFVLEPVQGKGVFIADDEYLRKVRELCSRHGTLLVFDEVQTGFGRPGRMFAMDHCGVEPDILVLSKALSAGMVPVGAVLATRRLWQPGRGTPRRRKEPRGVPGRPVLQGCAPRRGLAGSRRQQPLPGLLVLG